MKSPSTIVCLAAALSLAMPALSQDDAAQDAAAAPEFTEEYLSEPAHIEAGEAIWQEQCRHCHGRAAYPGKAPKLKPAGYTPEFVYDRVANGFKGMPAWKDYYDEEQIKAITAYVLSDDFSP